ncbi:MAG: DUF1294 domain-containing protein [Planctomycetota bacterium]
MDSWKLLFVLLVWIAGLSVVSFFAYWLDKHRAARGKRRIPEQTLLLFDLLGGWPGGFLAQRKVRHKNRKLSYQAKYWSVVILNVIVLGGLLYLATTR